MKGFSMKENKEIEKILLDDKAYNTMINSKIEQEFVEELKIAKSAKEKMEIYDLKEVPSGKLFSAACTLLCVRP